MVQFYRQPDILRDCSRCWAHFALGAGQEFCAASPKNRTGSSLYQAAPYPQAARVTRAEICTSCLSRCFDIGDHNRDCVQAALTKLSFCQETRAAPPLPPKPPLIASHSLRRSPPKVTVQKSPPLANPNVATLNTVPQAGSTPQPIRPLQPQSAPSGPVESAYFDVANAISNVQSLNDSWLQSLESIAPLDGSPNREKDAPPSEEIRFRYYSDVTQLIDRTNRGWKGLRQTVVDKAVEEALIRMTMVGPKQITPNEASQERRDFENASEIAERKETFSDIENGKINKSRYDPVLTYLRRLHLKLADYPETPTQQ